MRKENEVFFGEKGITSSSANYLANLAQEIITEDSILLDQMSFVTTKIDIIGSSSEAKNLKIGNTDEFVNNIPNLISKIASMNAFCAWIREAIKAKDLELNIVNNMPFEDWCTANNKELPAYPKMASELLESDIVAEMNIKERNEYLFLEAQASALGKYIHKTGKYNTARKTMYDKIATPITKEGSGKDTILYYHTPSANKELVEETFRQLQNKHREYEQRLNSIKFNIKEKVHERNVALYNQYKEEYDRVSKERNLLSVEYYTWRKEESSRISKLKIIIPNELASTYEYLNSLGKKKVSNS